MAAADDARRRRRCPGPLAGRMTARGRPSESVPAHPGPACRPGGGRRRRHGRGVSAARRRAAAGGGQLAEWQPTQWQHELPAAAAGRRPCQMPHGAGGLTSLRTARRWAAEHRGAPSSILGKLFCPTSTCTVAFSESSRSATVCNQLRRCRRCRRCSCKLLQIAQGSLRAARVLTCPACHIGPLRGSSSWNIRSIRRLRTKTSTCPHNAAGARPGECGRCSPRPPP